MSFCEAGPHLNLGMLNLPLCVLAISDEVRNEQSDDFFIPGIRLQFVDVAVVAAATFTVVVVT